MLTIGGSHYAAGLVHAAAYSRTGGGDLDSIRRLARDPLVQAIECSPPASDPESLGRLAALFAESGCEAVYVAGGRMRARGIDPGTVEVDAHRTAVEALEAMLEDAHRIGARLFLVCSGPDTAPAGRQGAIERTGEVLKALCRKAEVLSPDEPIVVTLEHFDRTLDKKLLLGPTAEAAALVGALRGDHANIGMTLDLSHLVQLGEDPTESVARAGELVVHAHIANCGLDPAIPETFGDSHCPFGAVGSVVEAAQVARFLAALERSGYGRRRTTSGLPIVSAEMIASNAQDPELVMANGLRMLYRAARMAHTMLTKDPLGRPSDGGPPCSHRPAI